MDLKLLWVDVMEDVWVTILSKVANEDKVARMKENPELEYQRNHYTIVFAMTVPICLFIR